MLESKAGKQGEAEAKAATPSKEAKKQAVGRASGTSFGEVVDYGLVFLISNFKSEI
ncbi:MAG TPA: hypothetical protein VH110_09865 [Candidatus Acidoferrum sp.]|jgi:hypothetical protein|nr:hypothetical protein [Candidatus Acidoferrum sp.]